VSNARQQGVNADSLFVKMISVDKGLVARRYRPFARGRAGSVRKTMSIVRLELAPVQKVKAKKAKTVKAEATA